MTDFDLQPVFNSMVEWPPNDINSDKLDRQNYIPLGISIKLKKGVSVKKEKFFELMEFLRKELSSWRPPLTDSFLAKNVGNFLMNAYSGDFKEKKVEELLNIFKLLKKKKVNIYVKIFNVQTDIGEYDGGSFLLFHPMYFIKTYPNHLMYPFINSEGINQDTALHSGVVFKNVEILEEDDEYLKTIIQEKTEEFINIMGVALGDKDNAQKISSDFNCMGMEYHLLNKDMFETNSSFSSAGSTFIKGSVNLKTELFFSQHKKLFDLLQKRDNQLKEKLYKSILWLGKSLRTENIDDSFLQVAIALECLLTKQDKGYYINPSITYSISETLAFLIGETKEQRIDNLKVIKKMYGERSAIVHSGKSKITINQYYEFFHRVRIGIYKILDLMEEHNFKNIEELYNYIDELKFS